jgi:RNA polymerase sigma factor (TIGR02999 family)
MPQSASKVTRLLDGWSDGDAEALEELMPLVVDDLRQVAAGYLAAETPGHTLQPTALVNEAFLRLVGRRTVAWRNRAQFFAVAAEIMRHVLVDHARRRKAERHGSGLVRVPLDDEIPARQGDVDLVALDEALRRLERLDPRQSRIVELRYFAGLTIEETAAVIEISAMTVKREWRTARLWLWKELDRE